MAAATEPHDADADADWQQQLEEALALAAILGSEDGGAFRLLHLPGQQQQQQRAGGGGDDNDGDDDDEYCGSAEARLEALLGSPPPGDAAGELEFEALVEVDLPEGPVQLLLQLPDDAGSGDSGESAPPALPFGPAVEFLPPLRVRLALPRRYPRAADAPPRVVALHAPWLSAAQRAALADGALADAWAEAGPGPVCYALLELLRESALRRLGLERRLLLRHGPDDGAPPGAAPPAADAGGGDVDDSSKSSSSSQQRQGKQQPEQQQQQPSPSPPPAAAAAAAAAGPERLAAQLLRYSGARAAAAFSAAMVPCDICLDVVRGADCLRLGECGHAYCRACLSQHARTRLEGGQVDARGMSCPEPSCRAALAPATLQVLLGGEGFARWEQLLLSRTLEQLEGCAYCPRCDTPTLADDDRCAMCPRCAYAFCSCCLAEWHPASMECLDPTQAARVMARRRGCADAGAIQADLMQQAMSLKAIAATTKPCPGCRMATTKHEGCNKMTCGFCAASWCWKCLAIISGYDHFKQEEGAAGPPRCRMFDQSEIDRWQRELLAGDRAREVEAGQAAIAYARAGGGGGAFAAGAGQFVVRLVPCPVCGQNNLRERKNNLLRCWSCTSHFCVACRQWLRGKVGQHFVGERACKQHGD